MYDKWVEKEKKWHKISADMDLVKEDEVEKVWREATNKKLGTLETESWKVDEARAL